MKKITMVLVFLCVCFVSKINAQTYQVSNDPNSGYNCTYYVTCTANYWDGISVHPVYNRAVSYNIYQHTTESFDMTPSWRGYYIIDKTWSASSGDFNETNLSWTGFHTYVGNCKTGPNRVTHWWLGSTNHFYIQADVFVGQ